MARRRTYKPLYESIQENTPVQPITQSYVPLTTKQKFLVLRDISLLLLNCTLCVLWVFSSVMRAGVRVSNKR